MCANNCICKISTAFYRQVQEQTFYFFDEIMYFKITTFPLFKLLQNGYAAYDVILSWESRLW